MAEYVGYTTEYIGHTTEYVSEYVAEYNGSGCHLPVFMQKRRINGVLDNFQKLRFLCSSLVR